MAVAFSTTDSDAQPGTSLKGQDGGSGSSWRLILAAKPRVPAALWQVTSKPVSRAGILDPGAARGGCRWERGEQGAGAGFTPPVPRSAVAGVTQSESE